MDVYICVWHGSEGCPGGHVFRAIFVDFDLHETCVLSQEKTVYAIFQTLFGGALGGKFGGEQHGRVRSWRKGRKERRKDGKDMR